ncbi:MAG: kinase-like domain-containing protein [Monoraphidium minutum]|nr:MAG: kinase-like domain-containing protein [Monoraphidium minutum]
MNNMEIPTFQATMERQAREWYRGGREVAMTRGADGAPMTVVTANTADGQPYVIKSLSKAFVEDRNGRAMLCAEIETHQAYTSPATPPLRDVVVDDEAGFVHLVFDYGGVPLLDAIDRSGSFESVERNVELAAHATACVFATIGPLHKGGRSYNDMKPGQMLVNAAARNGRFVQLCDFGAVTKIGSNTFVTCTFPFIPPEAHAALAEGADGFLARLTATLGPKFDVYASALSILIVALGGEHPFVPEDWELEEPPLCEAIPGCPWDPYVAGKVLSEPDCYMFHPNFCQLPSFLQDFVTAALDPNPEERPTIEQLKATEWGQYCLSLVEPLPEREGEPAAADALPADEPSTFSLQAAAAAAAPEPEPIIAGIQELCGTSSPDNSDAGGDDGSTWWDEATGCAAPCPAPIGLSPQAPAAAHEAASLRAALGALFVGAAPCACGDDAAPEAAEAMPAPESKALILFRAPSAVASPCLDVAGDDKPSSSPCSLPPAAAPEPEPIIVGGCEPSGGGASFPALDDDDMCRCCEEPPRCDAPSFQPITPPPAAPAAASEVEALRAALAALAGQAEADRAGRDEAEAQTQVLQAQIEELRATVASLKQQLCAAAAPPSSPCKLDPPQLVSADCSSSGDSCPSTPRRAASGRRPRSLFSRSSSGGGAAGALDCSAGGASLCGGAPSDTASSAPKRSLLQRGAHKVAKRLQQGLGRFACLLKGGAAATPSGV